MRRLASRTAGHGWHTELLVHADDFPNLDTMFADWPVDVVLGHMGYCRPGKAPGDLGFRALLRLMERGRCWVKLSGPYRIAPGNLPYPEAAAFARALRGVAPDRLVWGSDWPHVMVTKEMPNDGDLCDLLEQWIPDAGDRRKIAVDNATALYGFDRPG
jgi:predicted TIM-barrel fold metal-dependent hydrolase